MSIKESVTARQISILEEYATKLPIEKSRHHEERPVNTETRTDFQRDRDRIIYSKAFKRLMYKTQVFVNHEGDHYRTRLSHSIEVSQLARSWARVLGLNEDLTEAIALGHDLGHTPFGHSVEGLLNGLLKNEGGFLHNQQSVRVVELLEKKDGLFSDGIVGLNLTWEVREGILKHTKDSTNICTHLEKDPQPSLEAQLVNLADTIAYVTHDLEDGKHAGILDELIKEGILSQKQIDEIWDRFSADPKWGISSIINKLSTDVINTTNANISSNNIKTLQDVRQLDKPLVAVGEIEGEFKWLKKFVKKYIYQSPLATIMDTKAKRLVKRLYLAYWDNPKQLPYDEYERLMNFQKYQLGKSYQASPTRALCDFLASLTDRYAMILYSKLYDQDERIISAK